MGGVCETATLEDDPPAATTAGAAPDESNKSEPEEDFLWEQFPGCCTAQHMQDEVILANSKEHIDDFEGDPELENLEAEFEARFASQIGIFSELERQTSEEDKNGVELLSIRKEPDNTEAPPRPTSPKSSASSETLQPSPVNLDAVPDEHIIVPARMTAPLSHLQPNGACTPGSVFLNPSPENFTALPETKSNLLPNPDFDERLMLSSSV